MTINPRVLRLGYALRAFLETCERDFVPQWPLQTMSPRWGDCAREYRAERAQRMRGREAA
jgi:hypothetical protein